MDEWLKLAVEVQSLAQNGLAYSNNVFDTERYQRLRDISVQMIACASDLPQELSQKLLGTKTKEVQFGPEGAQITAQEQTYDDDAKSPYLGFGVIEMHQIDDEDLVEAILQRNLIEFRHRPAQPAADRLRLDRTFFAVETGGSGSEPLQQAAAPDIDVVPALAVFLRVVADLVAVKSGRFGKLARLLPHLHGILFIRNEPVAEPGPLLRSQIVAGNMVRTGGERLFQIVPEIGPLLPRNRVDEVAVPSVVFSGFNRFSIARNNRSSCAVESSVGVPPPKLMVSQGPSGSYSSRSDSIRSR